MGVWKTYDARRYTTIFRVFLATEVDEIQIDVEQSRASRLEVFGLVRVALDLGDLVYGGDVFSFG